MKHIADSYLYQTADYEEDLFKYLMTAQRVDKNEPSFNDVVYDVKRQASSVLMKVLLSKKVVLMLSQKGVSRAFKVIYMEDPKDHVNKVFIDCASVISYDNGTYACKKVGNLVSYLTTAMVYIIYYNIPKAILTNHTIMKSGTSAFVDLMLYILGYLKAPITFADNKERMSFVLAEYFQTCVAGRDNNETSYNLAKSISGIQEKKTCDYLHTKFGTDFEGGTLTFNKFLEKFALVFMDQEKGQVTPKNRALLTTDSFIHRWMYAFGPSTMLGLELFVPFSQMLTDVYVGAFLNQQNTIEKVAGSKAIHAFTNELLKVGSENA